MATAHLFIDYQNVHLSAWECFEPNMPVHHSLIDPGKFADEVQRVRNSLVHTQVTIEKIHVYRGQPSSEREVDAAARNKAQAAAWERDRRVKVHSRTLRYPRDWPETPSREKGVDVMLAVTLMRASIERWADVLILGSRDTDLLPALEAARTIDGSIVEVAGWRAKSRLRIPNERLWATGLEEESFDRCRDSRRY
ncbi:NYN domain-containing protein [Microbacterium arborescens]